ncbi:hypothetical protein KY333_03755 [Candidatus Woesearchaeota archaeon]|nr:hypothetical protein [Candidatus Woesearchaeota archaeon]
MKLSHFLIGMIVFSAFISGMFLFASSLEDGYGNTLNASNNLTTLRDKYDVMNETAGVANQAYNQTQTGSISGSNEISLLKVGWSAVKTVPASVSTFQKVTTDIGGDVGIPVPPFFIGMIIAIVLISITFAFITLIWGRKT